MRNNIEVTAITPELGCLMMPSANSNDRSMPLADSGVVDLFKANGVVLFRGFDLNQAGFVSYTEALTPDFLDYSGGAYARDKVNDNDTVLSVTGNRQFFAVPLHGEMFYTKYRPTVLWFYCISPPVSGGETTVCDGVAIYRQLSVDSRALFDSKKISYIRHYADGDWQKIYLSDSVSEVEGICRKRDTAFTYHQDDGSVSTEFTCSAITTPLYTDQPAFVNNILPVLVQEANGNIHSLVRFEDGERIPDYVVEELRELANKLTVGVEWQAGDLVMVDNSRLMHGRNSFNDTQRDLNVRMSATVFQ
jgi:alpha-ketoglutarate-dependent taurine dioxygenase